MQEFYVLLRFLSFSHQIHKDGILLSHIQIVFIESHAGQRVVSSVYGAVVEGTVSKIYQGSFYY